MAAAISDETGRIGPGGTRWHPAGVDALGKMVRPFARTASYYAHSWREYLDAEPTELPIARPTVALLTQAFLDEIALVGLRMRRPISDPCAFERITREVTAALSFYRQQGLLDRPEEFFISPAPLTEVTVQPVHRFGRILERIVFHSGYTPQPGEPGRDRWRAYNANAREYALMLRHREPRPWLVMYPWRRDGPRQP